MLRQERLNYILSKLDLDGKVNSLDLSKELGVSDDTIRRDLHELAEENKVQKVHGGALSKAKHPLDYAGRINFQKDEKLIMAEKGIKLLREKKVVLLDGSSSNYYIARLIPNNFQGIVVTNSIPIAQELLRCNDIELQFLGGTIDKTAQTTFGYDTIKELSGIRADICFLGVCSIDSGYGVFASKKEEAAVKQVMVNAADMVIAPVTSNKLGVKDYFKICETAAIDYVILSSDLTEEEKKMYPLKQGFL